MKNAWGVRNDVIILQFFRKIRKCEECVEYSTKLNQTKIQTHRSGNSILKYDVIYEALQMMCNKNLKSLRNYSRIGSFSDLGTKRILVKNHEIA